MNTHSARISSVSCPHQCKVQSFNHYLAVNDEQASVLFAGIFKQTVLNVINRASTWIKTTLDPFTPILIALLNTEAKKNFKEKSFNILDYYFDQITYNCYPAFSQLFDQQLQVMPTEENAENWMKIYNQLPLFKFFSKGLHFLKNLYFCS